MSFKNWGDYPPVVIITSIAALVTIASFYQTQLQSKNKATLSVSSEKSTQQISAKGVTPTPSKISPIPQVATPKISPSLIRVATPLLSLPCVNQNFSTHMRDENVSISKQVFLSSFNMRPDSFSYQPNILLTCPLSSGNFHNLSLGFGRKDGDELRPLSGRGLTKVTIFLNGKEFYTTNIKSGQKVIKSIDVSKTKDIAIEVNCVNKTSGCETIYFFESSLK